MASSPTPAQPDSNIETQVSVKVADHDDAKNLAVRMKADLEEKFREYQRSLWDLHQAISGRVPRMPPSLYPTLPAQPVEGES